MSRFLKIMVHLVVLFTIVGVLALMIPPFAGIRTTVITSADMQTNLPFGSATYSQTVSSGTLLEKDSVIINLDGGIYEYKIIGIKEGNTFILHDTRDASQEDQEVELNGTFSKVLFTVPFLGYLLIATQSVEGLIIIGLSVLFLLILYIIAELWKKEPKKNEEDEEAEEKEKDLAYGHVEGQNLLKSKKQLKQEEKERALRMKEEERQMKEEEKRQRKAAKKKKKAIRRGGFVDDLAEDEYNGWGEAKMEQETDSIPKEPVVVSGAVERLREQEAPAMTEEELGKTRTVAPRGKEIQEAAQEQAEMPRAEATPAAMPEAKETPAAESETKAKAAASIWDEPKIEEPVVYKKIAIPIYTAAELQQKAAAAGDEPDVYRDESSGVTLFDYSRVLKGAEEEDE